LSRKLLIFLSDSPFQNESVDSAIEISEAAIEKGYGVNIFLMMDGVYNPITSQSGEPFQITPVFKKLENLVKRGVQISCCRVCMELRGVALETLADGVDMGGIFDLSEMIEESDVVLSLVS
jgi:sulfur relay (sulfurtransferase) complex TusBCD TusD component (DsrE family)